MIPYYWFDYCSNTKVLQTYRRRRWTWFIHWNIILISVTFFLFRKYVNINSIEYERIDCQSYLYSHFWVVWNKGTTSNPAYRSLPCCATRHPSVQFMIHDGTEGQRKVNNNLIKCMWSECTVIILKRLWVCFRFYLIGIAMWWVGICRPTDPGTVSHAIIWAC